MGICIYPARTYSDAVVMSSAFFVLHPWSTIISFWIGDDLWTLYNRQNPYFLPCQPPVQKSCVHPWLGVIYHILWFSDVWICLSCFTTCMFTSGLHVKPSLVWLATFLACLVRRAFLHVVSSTQTIQTLIFLLHYAHLSIVWRCLKYSTDQMQGIKRTHFKHVNFQR